MPTPSEALSPPLSDLYRRHGPRLVATARAILGSDDLARDAVQEALVSCWERPTAPEDPCAWLVRTVVHRALHHARSRSRHRRREEHAARAEEDHGCDPAQLCGSGELGGLIHQALAELPAPLRSAFVQFELEERDYAAIALRQGVPIGTVRSRLSRARAALRRRLAEPLANEPWCLDCARVRRKGRR